jgi:hypothetical protein|tara:strand:+ start:198 stop:725 length:528 start_codon:yes stop_codon:yes gene_type:complete
MIYSKQNNMNAFELALNNFSVDDLENWSMIQDALKQRKKDLKQELRETKSKEKSLKKEDAKKQKKEEKEQQKKLTADEKDKENDYEKTRGSLQAIIMRGVRKEAKTNKPKAPSFNNYSAWISGIKGDDNAGPGAPTQEELDSCGGRREWKKIEWAKFTKEQKDSKDAPWNAAKAE